MSQNDFIIANADGATVRADINSALQAAVSLSKGSTEPNPAYEGQFWWDDSNNLIKIRNSGNSAWVTAFNFDGTTLTVPTASIADSAVTRAKLASAAAPNHNYILNGDFRVAQRGTSFDSTTTPANSDGEYLFDQWLLLSDGNDAADVSQDTSNAPTGAYSCCKFDTETANKKFGVFQPLEARDAAALIGGNATLSFSAKKEAGNSTLDTIRAAIISWDSTADSITSDVVSGANWNAAGTDPTLVTNWTYENTPSDLTLTNSYQTFTIENVSIDTASTTNVGVFIWVDNTDATVGDIWYLSKVKLELSSDASDYIPQPYKQELEQCQRFYWENGTLSGIYPMGTAYAQSTTSIRGFIHTPTEMRTAPTITGLDTYRGGGGSVTVDTISTVVVHPHGVSFLDNSVTGATADETYMAVADNTGKLVLDAVL